MTVDNRVLVTLTHAEYEAITEIFYECRRTGTDFDEVINLIIEGDGATDDEIIIKVLETEDDIL